jgi:predicted membrane protein
MDIKDEEKEERKPQDDGPSPRQQWKSYMRWRIVSGLFIILIGCGLIFERTGYLVGVHWLFTWPMILIVIGLFILIRHGFRNPGPLIPIAIGTVFLLQEIYPSTHIEQFIWPVVLITIGLAVILGKHRRCGPGPFFWGGPHNHDFRGRMKQQMREKWGDDWHEKWHQFRKDKESWHEWKRSRYQAGTSTPAGEVLDVNAVFGGVKRTVLSKNFAGGEINAVLGGCEIDLTKADFNGRVVLEINSVFGGTQLYVPPTWTVIPEMDTVFGSLEDKRPTQVLHPDPEKVLVLRGSNVFGGTELSLR